MLFGWAYKYLRLIACKFGDNVAQREQTLVDVGSFLSSFNIGSHFFRAGQINQILLASVNAMLYLEFISFCTYQLR